MIRIKGFAYNNIIKNTIINDIKMPSIYLEKGFLISLIIVFLIILL